jgi:hypothetical protein
MVNQLIHTVGRESWKDNNVVAKYILPYFSHLLRSLNLFPGISPCSVVLMALGIACVEGNHRQNATYEKVAGMPVGLG